MILWVQFLCCVYLVFSVITTTSLHPWPLGANQCLVHTSRTALYILTTAPQTIISDTRPCITSFFALILHLIQNVQNTQNVPCGKS